MLAIVIQNSYSTIRIRFRFPFRSISSKIVVSDFGLCLSTMFFFFLHSNAGQHTVSTQKMNDKYSTPEKQHSIYTHTNWFRWPLVAITYSFLYRLKNRIQSRLTEVENMLNSFWTLLDMWQFLDSFSIWSSDVSGIGRIEQTKYILWRSNFWIHNKPLKYKQLALIVSPLVFILTPNLCNNRAKTICIYQI